MHPIRLAVTLVSLLGLLSTASVAAPFSTNANRLAYLDEDNPFYPHRDFPKLTTPQWVGEPGVEAVVILAIDDMRDSKKYETYLRPILDRLKKMDGRAPVSIFANVVEPSDPQLQTWLKEGLSLEVHTLTHPCPLLQKGSFTNAWNTYHGGVDLLNKVPGNKPVAFRMPCCDSMNSPSPRFYSEIFNRTSPDDNFLQADSSVMCLLTDDFLKRHGVPHRPVGRDSVEPHSERSEASKASISGKTAPAQDTRSARASSVGKQGSTESRPTNAASDHFRRYFPAQTNAVTKKSLANFGTYLEDYPYPYVINRTGWEFPAMVPSDWEAFNAHGPTNAATVADWQLALDAVVRAQGVFTFIFHPHGWIRSDQIIQFIDHAERTHGKKVKFLTFKEAVERLNKNLLSGSSIRDRRGNDNGVRLLDVNNDGFMDVIGQNESLQGTRLWTRSSNVWVNVASKLPLKTSRSGFGGETLFWRRVQFGVLRPGGNASACYSDEQEARAWHFERDAWAEDTKFWQGLALEGKRIVTGKTDFDIPPSQGLTSQGHYLTASDLTSFDRGARFRDFDRDGRCELLVSNDKQNILFAWSDAERTWKQLPYALPPGLALVNERGEDNGLRFVDLNGDGFDDLLLSNEKEYAIYLWAREVKPHLGWHAGWSHKVLHEQRGAPVSDPARTNVAPPRAGSESGAPKSATPTNHSTLITLSSKEIPPFVRSGPHRNNGAWFHRGQLFIQNEDTAHLPDVVWRKSFSELIAFDMPAPKTPAESQQCFQVRPGFRVELVAAEPLVQSPVAFEWGADGRLWVVEMGDYPNGIPVGRDSVEPHLERSEASKASISGKAAPDQNTRSARASSVGKQGSTESHPTGGARGGGKVKFLEDLDGDGIYDKATVFLDGIPFPTGVMPWRKGVLISAAPDILYAEDTDGDGKADVKQVLFTGFREGNQQHRVNGFELGLDNWIYGANGDSGGTITFVSTTASSPSPPLGERAGVRGQTPPSPKGSPTNSVAPPPHPQSLSPAGGEGSKTQTPDARPHPLPAPVSISGRDFRFRPDTGEFEAIEGQTQFGRRRDDWGNWFGNNNPNWLWHYWLPDRYLRRNPHLAVKSSRQMLANYTNSTRCYPISTPPIRFNQPQSVGHVTSGCSPAPYRDDLFGPGFATSVFISEPVHNLVHREVLVPDGVSFTSRRAPDEQDREFLASTDNWFRPTMLKTGPDGALYIADFYRFVLEHPEWIAPETQARLDLRAGADKGRIWRVVPVDQPLRKIPNLAKLNTTQLVAALDSPSGWQRDAVQRLLVERQDKAAVEGLRNLLMKPGEAPRPEPLTASPPAPKLSTHALISVTPATLPTRETSKATLAKAQLHALWTLDGLGAIGADVKLLWETLRRAQGNPPLIEQVLRVSERYVGQARFNAELKPPYGELQYGLNFFLQQVAELPRSESARLRFQFALSLSDWPTPPVGKPIVRETKPGGPVDGVGVGIYTTADTHLLRMARRETNAQIQTAVLTSVPKHALAMVESAVNSGSKRQGYGGYAYGPPVRLRDLPNPVIQQLMTAVLANGDDKLLGELLKGFVPTGTGTSEASQLTALNSLMTALDQNASSLEKLAQTRPALRPELGVVSGLLATARTTALSQSAIANRQSAITLLGRGPSGRTEDLATLATLLKPQQPAEIQSAAVAQLAKLGGSDSASALLADWKAHSPALREAVLSALLSRPTWIDTLLAALERGQVAPAQISPAQRQKLTTHPQAALRDRAAKLFAATSADRAKVIKDYAVVVTLAGSETRGRELFTKNCGVCHKLKGEGREIGPDLGQVTTRDTDWLLTAILDPNAAVEARYLGYTAETKSGREFTGIITAETPNNLVMRGADGTEETILRTDLKQLHGSGLSLMPEGMEAALKPQDMADLLAFLRGK